MFKFFLPEINILHFLILGMGIGVVAQFGDLAESIVKRACSTKDSGAVVPGIGGVLDLIDSLTFSVCLTYFYVTFFL